MKLDENSMHTIVNGIQNPNSNSLTIILTNIKDASKENLNLPSVVETCDELKVNNAIIKWTKLKIARLLLYKSST